MADLTKEPARKPPLYKRWWFWKEQCSATWDDEPDDCFVALGLSTAQAAFFTHQCQYVETSWKHECVCRCGSAR